MNMETGFTERSYWAQAQGPIGFGALTQKMLLKNAKMPEKIPKQSKT